MPWMGACDDHRRVTGPEEGSSAIIVSDPALSVVLQTGLRIVVLSSAHESELLSAGATSFSHVAFVSLPSGTVPNGVDATVRNRRTGRSVTAPIVAGGLDPIAIDAVEHDVLDLEVNQAGNTTALRLVHSVPGKKRPKVVRVNPPPGKRDVALNSRIAVVFSEPIDSRTVDTGAVRLLRGTTPVMGRLEFEDADHVTAAFVPNEPLVPGSEYQLVVNQNVHDLDGERLEEAVATDFTTMSAPPISIAGQIAFASYRDAASSSEIYVMNADGTHITRLTNNYAEDVSPTWSPDGKQLLFVSNRDLLSFADSVVYPDNALELYVMNLDGSGIRRLTNNRIVDSEPAWSPDGKKIAFRREDDAGPEIYLMNADGSSVTRLTDSPGHVHGPTWSPDGSSIAYAATRDGVYKIHIVSADGTGVRQWISTGGDQTSPAWSPDGSRIAFAIDNRDIYVALADGTSLLRLTNDAHTDFAPVWSPDGSTLAFESDRLGNFNVHVISASGGPPSVLASHFNYDGRPSWSSRSDPAIGVSHLGFTVEPSSSVVNEPIAPAVQVSARDAGGNLVTAFSGDVTIGLLENPHGAVLTGTTTVAATNGVATFSDLRVDKPGFGYVLAASAGGLGVARSVPFEILGDPALSGALVYFSNFETAPGPEWSHTLRSDDPRNSHSRRTFLGRFGCTNYDPDGNNEPQISECVTADLVTLTLADLPPHAAITISFDLYLFDSWDGNPFEGEDNGCEFAPSPPHDMCSPDLFNVSVAGGPTLLHATFAVHPERPYQSYPAPYPTDGSMPIHNARHTGAAEVETIAGAVYRLTFTFTHSEPTVSFTFTAPNLQPLDDESWGLDNVEVRAKPLSP